MSSSRPTFTTIRTEGGLLPADLLQRLAANDREVPGLTPESYHLSGEKLSEAINRAWNRLQGAWAAFAAAREKDPTEYGVGLTRERWLLPLFQELGYGRLLAAKPLTVGDKTYPISHMWAEVPLHLVGYKVDLDKRTPGAVGAAKASPHSLVQEYLNRAEASQWGFVANGLRLRVLRDNASLSRQAFVEFDLDALFTGEVYADFVVLWLVCHQSRVETHLPLGDGHGEPGGCYLEQWAKLAQERGTRALDSLRTGVETAIATLGRGFLAHPANSELRDQLRVGTLSPQEYYRELLRLVYRLIFLFVAEDRALLFHPEADPAARERYTRFYSTARLRRLAEHQRGSRHSDGYEALKAVMSLLSGEPAPVAGVAALGLPPLGGFLFSTQAVPHLTAAQLANADMLTAVRALAFTRENKTRRVVDYKNLGSEELGSVYESLLELHPRLEGGGGLFSLHSAAGSERKTTGSYYTPSSLIQVLLDSALEPVIENALKSATEDAVRASRSSSVLRQEKALLNLKIIDPACGSGHFLVAAAHRLARRLASVRTGEGEPAPEAQRAALRAVISNCIYGADINPMSVELCKVSLWMEALEPGKPLSFLDAHIQCGDSLVGVAPGLDVSEILDEAFNPAFGDDKATSSALKKRNKAERGGQMGLDVFVIRDAEDLQAWMAQRAERLEALPDDTLEQVGQKARDYQEYLESPQYKQRKLEYDLWTASFFWKMEPLGGSSGILAPTQEMLRRVRAGGGGSLPLELVRRVNELAQRLNFLHWELRFPKVFTGQTPGFDVVLGNPPWERIKLQEEEFFAERDPEIAAAPNKAARQKLINVLEHSNPALAAAFEDAKHAAECSSKFLRLSERFPLTAAGDINTYALFAELSNSVLTDIGRSGLILPVGIATDNTNKDFFATLIERQALAQILGFENEEFIFTDVHNEFKFCAFTTTGTKIKTTNALFTFFCRRIQHVQQAERQFTISRDDLELLNPNTQTTPIFRTRTDAQLTKDIYHRVLVLVHEPNNINQWGVEFSTMYHMSNDSGKFQTRGKLENDGYEMRGNTLFKQGGETYVPLIEAKMIWQFDHRFASLIGVENAGNRPSRKFEGWYGVVPTDPSEYPIPRYWVPISETENRIYPWKRHWLFAFRDITSSINERTAIFSLVPNVGYNDQLLYFDESKLVISTISCLLGNLNSLVFDYVTRQKVGGTHLKKYILYQLPVLPPSAYTPADIAYIAPRVLELVYTAYDLRPFAEDMWEDSNQLSVNSGQSLRDLYVAQWEANRRDAESAAALARHPAPAGARFPEVPFIWNESRRAQLRAELDAYYARLYRLTRDELRYILDPKEVHGEDFPGETFRVLKEKEIRLYGEYRTRRLVLEAWDKWEG